MSPHPPQRIVVGISGASGAAYARRLIRVLLSRSIEVHLVVSPLGQRLLHDELGMEGVDLPALAGVEPHDAAVPGVPGLIQHNYRDVGAPIASGSFRHAGMVIIPCSSNSLSAVATGASQNLMHRAAHVSLKERRKLVLVHRETPLSLIDIRNMQAVAEAGGIVCPANPGFYLLPESIDDLVDFVVARVLDLLGVEHELSARWGESKNSRAAEQQSSR
jgi:polyprenyl P-hydroxybenzoate/phenylacrylic acid decarboxylase-like protein